MSEQTDIPTLGSPYRRGANSGVPMGVCLSVMFALWSLGMVSAAPASNVLSMAALCVTLLAVVLLAWLQRRGYVADGGMTTFSGVWMHGIMTVIFGSLIAMVAGYVYMRWINPDFLGDLYTTMYDKMRQMARDLPGKTGSQYAEMADTLKQMMDHGLMPTVMQLLSNVLWSVCFGGCILSLITAAIVMKIPLKNNPTDNR